MLLWPHFSLASNFQARWQRILGSAWTPQSCQTCQGVNQLIGSREILQESPTFNWSENLCRFSLKPIHWVNHVQCSLQWWHYDEPMIFNGCASPNFWKTSPDCLHLGCQSVRSGQVTHKQCLRLDRNNGSNQLPTTPRPIQGPSNYAPSWSLPKHVQCGKPITHKPLSMHFCSHLCFAIWGV